MDKNHEIIHYITRTAGHTVLDYTEGSRGTDYHFVALVKTSAGEYDIWHFSQTFDYDEMVGTNRRRRLRSWDREMEDDPRELRLDYADFHDFGVEPDWLDSEDKARVRYDELVDRLALNRMSVEDFHSEVRTVLEYQGRPYGRNLLGEWEPNY